MSKRIVVNGKDMDVRDYLEVEKSRSSKVRPFARAAVIIANRSTPDWKENIGKTMVDLTSIAQDVWEGNLQHAEHMLIAQASALQSLFFDMAEYTQISLKNLDAAERYLRLALKAQNQSRATLQTLALLKSPPPVYANQANIAHGPQQVNNHEHGAARGPASNTSPPEKSVKRENELLEAFHGEQLDTRTPKKAGRADSPVEAMASINRPKKRRR